VKPLIMRICGAILTASWTTSAQAQLTPGIWQSLSLSCNAESNSYTFQRCKEALLAIGCQDATSAFYAWGGRHDLNFPREVRKWIITTCIKDPRAERYIDNRPRR
jgi:hypothetical protein